MLVHLIRVAFLAIVVAIALHMLKRIERTQPDMDDCMCPCDEAVQACTCVCFSEAVVLASR